MSADILQFPDRPENVEALEAMKDAVRAHMAIGFDREQFLKCAELIWDGVVLTDSVVT